MYLELDVVLNETFADTATMEYLVRRAAERGLTPYPATYAELKAFLMQRFRSAHGSAWMI